MTLSQTITFSKQELKEVIIAFLKNKGYTVYPDDIKFNISSHLEGYVTGRKHEVYFFKDCEVNVLTSNIQE